MNEQEVPENYPKCRFCGIELADGDFVADEKGMLAHSSPGLLGVCDACYDLVVAIIEDNIPHLLGEIMSIADHASREKVKLFDSKNWEKYVKKKPKA